MKIKGETYKSSAPVKKQGRWVCLSNDVLEGVRVSRESSLERLLSDRCSE